MYFPNLNSRQTELIEELAESLDEGDETIIGMAAAMFLVKCTIDSNAMESTFRFKDFKYEDKENGPWGVKVKKL